MKVEVIESTPDPEEVACRAARNDYMEEYGADKAFEEVMAGVDGDNIEEKKETLIHHLLNHGHFGPFEHPQITFHVKGVSRSLMAQLTRHRHASFDVQSMRYVNFEDADPAPGETVVTIPELDNSEIHGRNAEFADFVKEDLEDDNTTTTEETIANLRNTIYRQSIVRSFSDYKQLIDYGVAPENARMVLPIGTKVNIVFSVNARMLMHIADMRAAADAQWEIREMTEEVLELAEDWMPETFKYYDEEMKHRKNRLAP